MAPSMSHGTAVTHRGGWNVPLGPIHRFPGRDEDHVWQDPGRSPFPDHPLEPASQDVGIYPKMATAMPRGDSRAGPRPSAPEVPARGSDTAVRAILAIHTLAWFSIEGCVAYVLYAGFAGRSDRRAGICAGVVAAESLIFAGNGFRCPLTQMAERLGAERGSVTDIYLPRWVARSLPAIHVPLIALAGLLHARNLAGGCPSAPPSPGEYRRLGLHRRRGSPATS